uniref:Uncharacterized protein n=1 Tax=Siphoviridae sp. ctBLh2 TaxID=2827803 RepID=A0A8S5S4H1_9CAUD|nr:MAG TPA: hypothetical protein [Siphoviridae sp. ctBLh2]
MRCCSASAKVFMASFSGMDVSGYLSRHETVPKTTASIAK